MCKPATTIALIGLSLLASATASAVQPAAPGPAGSLSEKTRFRQRPAEGNNSLTLQELQARAAGVAPGSALAKLTAVWSAAPQALGPHTIVHVDPLTGGPVSVQPDGLPWIPGTGMNNHLTRADLARFMPATAGAESDRDPADANGVNQAVLERIAREFMAQHPAWFPVPASELRLHLGMPDPIHYVKHVMFDHVVNGVQVEDALLVFHISHGNLVSFGGQWIGPVTVGTTPALTGADARAAALSYAGVAESAVTFGDKPELKLVISDDGRGAAPGAGYPHRLVYAVTFHKPGETGNWRTEVDAQTGEVVRFEDINEYNGTIVGGVQPLSNDGVCPTGCEQTGYPMPFTDTALVAPNNFTDTGGNYVASGASAVTTTLNGKYVKITDTCGAMSKGGANPATIDLGTSAGTDCTIPAGGGGAGNTHSARDAFYNVNKLKEEVRGWLPAFAFNNAQVTVNVNLNQTCNAYWNGTSLNMFHDGGSTCRNTGEIAMIFDHELGHGYDANDGGGASNPGEAYADNTAQIHHHDPCIGRGFFKSGKCGGYGDACTTCTGVRGSDWTGHVSHVPHTVPNPAGGGGYTCPAGGDICGRETHCAAYPIIEAVWDSANIDLPHNAIPAGGGAACAGTSPGNPTTASQAWTLMSKLWWKGVGTLGSQYTCATNGTAGCGTATTFHVLKVQDDDDGNLTNGTPHAAELECAFNRHQVGCNTDTNTDSSSCPALLLPTVTAVAGNNQAGLSWTAVTNATQYRVFRNEEGCGAGYALIATLPSGTLNYTDTGLLNARTYYYQIQPVGGASNQCDGQPSACTTVTPQSCVAPATPTIGTATVPGNNQINVSWTNGAPASTKFNVYRAVGTCAAPGPFSTVATGLPVSPLNYTDSTVSGTITYAYKVSGTENTGSCESAQSGCVQATATGACTLPPAFAGAASAGNSAQSTCTVALAWAAGVKQCGTAGPTVTYNVYRSTTSGFTPAVANRVATGVVGTGYNDSTGLTNNVTYYYVVRAVDSLGNEDANLVQRSTAPTGPTGPGTFSETFEGPGGAPLNAGWVVDNVIAGATNPWVGSTTLKHAGTYSAFDADDPANSDHAYESPSLAFGAASVLTFWHTWSLENQVGPTAPVLACGANCFDAGVLEYRLGAGAWTRITQAQITGSTYNGSIDTGAQTDNPLGCNVQAYVGGTGTPAAFAQATVNIGTLAGAGAGQIRWRQADDTGNQNTQGEVGWYLDDVQVTNLTGGVPTTCSTGCSATPMSSNVLDGKSGVNFVMNWTAVAGASTYNVYRNTSPNTGTWGAALATGIAGLTYNDAGQLSNAISQFYSVTDVNGCGAESPK